MVRTYFYLNFTFAVLFDMVIPIIKIFKLKIYFRLESGKQRNSYEKDKYRDINAFIEKESEKDDFNVNPDIDGTIGGYLGVILDYAFLNVFGLVYPLSFPLILVMIILRMYIYKMKLLYTLKRPLP